MLRIQPPTVISLSKYFSRSLKSSLTVVNCMIVSPSKYISCNGVLHSLFFLNAICY